MVVLKMASLFPPPSQSSDFVAKMKDNIIWTLKLYQLLVGWSFYFLGYVLRFGYGLRPASPHKEKIGGAQVTDD